MTSHSLLHSSLAGLSPRWWKEKKTWGSQWRKDLPNKIPLDLKTALGDPRIAHVLLVATFSSQGRVENSMILPWLGLASGIVLWDTQRSKCSPRSLGLPTGTYVTWVSGWSMALYIFYKTGDLFLRFWRTSLSGFGTHHSSAYHSTQRGGTKHHTSCCRLRVEQVNTLPNLASFLLHLLYH